jgi:hypothetical protein
MATRVDQTETIFERIPAATAEAAGRPGWPVSRRRTDFWPPSWSECGRRDASGAPNETAHTARRYRAWGREREITARRSFRALGTRRSGLEWRTNTRPL